MNSSFSHVALLVPSVDRAAAYLESRGIETGEPESFESEGTKEVYVGSYDKQRGLLLLLEAISDGPYKRAMSKRGPSLHHLAIDVSDIQDFLPLAEKAGWKRHEVSAQTMSHKTAWLYLKGIPTLIEVHQKKKLSSSPLKVSRVEMPIHKSEEDLFEAIGLGDVVFSTPDELCLTVDGHKLPFAQIASLN